MRASRPPYSAGCKRGRLCRCGGTKKRRSLSPTFQDVCEDCKSGRAREIPTPEPSSRDGTAELTASHKPHIPPLMTTIVLIAAAFLGGALNSLAGGGALATLPAVPFACPKPALPI